MMKRKTVAFPVEFIEKCQIKARESCRPLTWYIQYVIKNAWEMEDEDEKKESKEK